ncbi:MAG TPA: hypothetical protein VF815_00425 [Myxococcaceae bacterium]|jgi:hypothetical protein
MRSFAVSVSFVFLVVALGSGAALAGGAEPARAKTLDEAWRLLPQMEGNRCGEDLVFDYQDAGGMRNFFCRGLSVISWKTFLSLAPVKPFRSGPHKGGKLDLQNAKDFGRYDPAFVKWAVKALVPGAEDAKLRQETQPVYDRSVRTLARTYYGVWRVLSANPKWVEVERKRYLGAAAKGNLDALGPELDPYHDVLGNADENWGGYDPNHVRSATMWWLRRYSDGTASTWAEGLERLLQAYDAEWLGLAKREKARSLTARKEKVVPEYKQ